MKRRLRTLLVFLILGAIVNVAVAWGCAIFVSPQQTLSLDLHYGLYTGFGTVRIKSFWEHEYLALMSDPKGDAAPGWSTVARSLDHEAMVVSDGRGLPLICLVGELVFETSDMDSGWVRSPDGNGFFIPEHWRTRWAIRVQDGLRSEEIKLLPLRPVVSGFAVNTIFYSAILWLLFAAPFVYCHHRRIKRGLCPACAYPVGQSPICTECGKAHSSA